MHDHVKYVTHLRRATLMHESRKIFEEGNTNA